MGSLRLVRSAPTPAPVPKGDCLEAFDRELDYVFGTLQRLGIRPNDVEDSVQEIFMVFHRNWPTLDATRSLRPWLFGVAFRVACAHRRRSAREAPHAELDPEDGSPTPEAWLQGQESLALLSSALQHVPAARRSVVIKHDLEGLDIIDIARELSLTKFGVYARLYKGRERAGLRRPALAREGSAEMKRHGSDLPPELEAFLHPRRIQRQVPPPLRTRLLARARAALEGGAIPPARRPEAPPMPLARGRRLLRIALAASFAVAGVAVAAVAARHGRGALISPVASAGHPAPAPRVAIPRGGSTSTETPPPPPDREAAKPPHPARRGARSDPFAAEIALLQQAQGAYTRHDFSVALILVAAHERRFPRGPLAEQREALRVRSLDGAGRAHEAHRAAAAFAARFPRSVLLPRAAGGAESSGP